MIARLSPKLSTPKSNKNEKSTVSIGSHCASNSNAYANPVGANDDGKGLSTQEQQYDPTSIINEVRSFVDRWRVLPSSQWQVTPEMARLLQHWRHHKFSGVIPFFCQVEAVETAIWLTEVASHSTSGKRLLGLLVAANQDANPELLRLALKLATGAGKTTVMAMLIAWQTINAERRPGGKNFTRGFLVLAPGLTIKDRLRVLQPNDPDSYYANPVLKARMNADLHMADDLKNTGKGNLFAIFGEPDITLLPEKDSQIRVKVNGVDVFHPNTPKSGRIAVKVINHLGDEVMKVFRV